MAPSELATLRDDLARFDGTPPYDTPGNPCYLDGYYAKSLEKKYGKPLSTLRALVKR